MEKAVTVKGKPINQYVEEERLKKELCIKDPMSEFVRMFLEERERLK